MIISTIMIINLLLVLLFVLKVKHAEHNNGIQNMRHLHIDVGKNVDGFSCLKTSAAVLPKQYFIV